jgi:hypothetical protein
MKQNGHLIFGGPLHVRPTNSSLPQPARIKKTLKVDEALFSTKSSEEFGLPPLLVDRLNKASLLTEVQAAAIPTRV